MQVEFPEKLAFLFEPARYKVAYGGRGGAKSWGFGRALLIMGAQRPLRVLCAREFQNSIAESAHALKGADKARWHVGVIAQDIATAFEAEGEDAFAWSVLCRTPDTVMVPVAVDDPEADGGRRVEIEERPVLDADGRQTSTLSVRYDEWQNLVLAARLAA